MLCRTTRLARISVPATFVGFKRNKHNQHMQQSLLKIKCAEDKKAASYYLGKKVAAIIIKKHKKSTVWGKIIRTHGDNGVVRVKFNHNLCPHWMGLTCRVMLYPQRD